MEMLKQFNLARSSLLSYIEELDEEIVDKQSKYFEQTIRWHIGNTLFMFEKFLFVSRDMQILPTDYAELFSADISVSDWKIKPPTLYQLVENLVHQQQRINEFSELFWKTDVKFKVPNGSVETHGDLLIMLAHREAETLGKIKIMKQVLEKEDH
ncbi:DinB family protein [Caldibacillus thermolactis]|jgi:hypothetical protein|uniref:DinB family protein n=1 Tax=Pallidibacillus thermolactis TaxID=251051 RepID=A0ABT2WGC8_9BACI|nr:DinB family protein [Pallidibacillus thermolactis]MCU9593729.1 DinB family protein [Pallidibacillus thermolactis]MCU9601660.1 DinB family protein [Pallidibacillus thermolactis subsp. kokeshiiformis]MED1674732.1 hypothetical protein [Pallidibacillus thermolactis subsp. kokeshiiformis]